MNKALCSVGKDKERRDDTREENKGTAGQRQSCRAGRGRKGSRKWWRDGGKCKCIMRNRGSWAAPAGRDRVQGLWGNMTQPSWDEMEPEKSETGHACCQLRSGAKQPCVHAREANRRGPAATQRPSGLASAAGAASAAGPTQRYKAPHRAPAAAPPSARQRAVLARRAALAAAGARLALPLPLFAACSHRGCPAAPSEAGGTAAAEAAGAAGEGALPPCSSSCLGVERGPWAGGHQADQLAGLPATGTGQEGQRCGKLPPVHFGAALQAGGPVWVGWVGGWGGSHSRLSFHSTARP